MIVWDRMGVSHYFPCSLACSCRPICDEWSYNLHSDEPRRAGWGPFFRLCLRPSLASIPSHSDKWPHLHRSEEEGMKDQWRDPRCHHREWHSVHRPKWPFPTGLYNNAKCVIMQKWQIMKIQLNDDSTRMSLWLVILFISLLHSFCTYECWNLVDEGLYFEADQKADSIKITFILVCFTPYLVSNRNTFLKSNFTMIVWWNSAYFYVINQKDFKKSLFCSYFLIVKWCYVFFAFN